MAKGGTALAVRGRTGLVLQNTPVVWTSHVDGMPHVRSTIAKMSELARKGAESYAIRNLATRITRNVPSKFPTAELGALYRWVRDNIRYRYDPLGLEWLQSPSRTVLEGAGDCDDMATLLGALAGALGHPYRFRTVGASPTVQQHVQVQAFDRKRWINLDPVLEPTQYTTAPRTDPGTFAAFAVGSDHLWNSEGTMISGLAGPVSRQEMELWEFAPYFTQVPPYGGDSPPRFGVSARWDARYRSAGAPGPWQMPRKMGNGAYAIALRPGTLSPGQLAGVMPFYHPTLGAGKILRKIKKFGKKVVKGVKTVVNKVPGLKQIAKMAVSVIPGASTVIQAGKAVKGVAKGIKKIKQAKKGAKKAVAAARPKALPKPKAPKIAAVGKKPVPAKPKLVPMRTTPASTSVALAARAASSPSSAKAKQYPPNARMLWDRGAGMFRVFVPIAGAPVAISVGGDEGDSEVAGFGAFKPSLTFSLLGATSPTAQTKAKAAIAAVQAFIAKNKKPPAIALPAVKAFQQVAGGAPALKPDGLWGSNTKAAAGYHAPGVALPATAPAFTKGVTWKPSAGAAGPAKTQPKAPPAGASFSPPPGYVEVGTEASNPGLPPAGYTGPAAPPAPPVPGTPPQPSAPDGGAPTDVPPPTVDLTDGGRLNPPSSTDWAPAGGGPGITPVPSAADVPTSPTPTTVPGPGGAIVVAPGTPPPVTDVAIGPGGQVIPLPAPPLPAGPYPNTPAGQTLYAQDQQWLKEGAGYRGGSAPGSDNDSALWLAIAYLYLTRKKAA